jgi:hypothetical protein
MTPTALWSSKMGPRGFPATVGRDGDPRGGPIPRLLAVRGLTVGRHLAVLLPIRDEASRLTMATACDVLGPLPRYIQAGTAFPGANAAQRTAAVRLLNASTAALKSPFWIRDEGGWLADGAPLKQAVSYNETALRLQSSLWPRYSERTSPALAAGIGSWAGMGGRDAIGTFA